MRFKGNVDIPLLHSRTQTNRVYILGIGAFDKYSDGLAMYEFRQLSYISSGLRPVRKQYDFNHKEFQAR